MLDIPRRAPPRRVPRLQETPVFTTLLQRVLHRRRLVVLLFSVATAVTPIALTQLVVDTDPENMLSSDDPVRVRTDDLADRFGLGPQIAVGLVAADGLTAPQLSAAIALEPEIAALPGVVEHGVIGPGALVGPQTLAAPDGLARARATIADHALLGGQVLSADGTTATLLVGLVDDRDAPAVAEAARRLVADDVALDGTEVAVAGAPLAQEAFGRQMFVQMAIFAPLAALVVIALVLVFFRALRPVVATMTVAMSTVLLTMGLLIGTGNTVHIMSSMIPIFLLPIAILDAVHVLSEYAERAREHSDRTAAILAVYGDLVRPITFTSVTTAIGFGSLALTPIPPVRTFGIFVAVGVAIAWLATMVLLPVLLLGMDLSRENVRDRSRSPLARLVRGLGAGVLAHRRAVLGAAAAVAVVAGAGLTLIEVNDDPVEWFRADHEVRRASETLAERLAGTANLHLVVEGGPGALVQPGAVRAVHGIATDLAAVPEVGSVASYTAMRADDPLLDLLVTPDGAAANVWLRLRSGDNQTVEQVLAHADDVLAATPLPDGLQASWAGQAVLNLTWQDQMVSGMVRSFAAALALLVLVLVGLYRSVRWGLLAAVPVVWTVLITYGAIGWLGIDFNMPIAVLSTLALGIGVDFAIHFVSRFRTLRDRTPDSRAAVRQFMEEPARAVTRNAMIVAIGFVPLVLADLVPYVVVGLLLASIMVLSWLATLVLLPALVTGRPRQRRMLDPRGATVASVPRPATVATVGAHGDRRG